jgi:hypothetical protein
LLLLPIDIWAGHGYGLGGGGNTGKDIDTARDVSADLPMAFRIGHHQNVWQIRWEQHPTPVPAKQDISPPGADISRTVIVGAG